jgi:p-cumate 2,3-dioxygenase subunit beta
VTIGRSAVEDFLFQDAALLDDGRFDQWLELFTTDAVYQVPPLGRPDADVSNDTFLVNDDRFHLNQRVASLQKRSAHAERPRSVTRRLVSNVRIVADRDQELDVSANFCIFRYRGEDATTFVGQYHLSLSNAPDLKFRRRIAVLDTPVLPPAGIVSILL